MRDLAILIDTNVIINFITDRDDPYREACNRFMELCANGDFKGYIAFHTLSTVWYVVRRQKSEKEARFWLEKICDMLLITSASQEQIKDAIQNQKFRDFEDCMQDECAVYINAEYLVTCNVKDFQYAKSNVLTPDECVKMLENSI